MISVSVNTKEIVPDHVSDFIMKEDELIVGFIKQSVTVSRKNISHTGEFFILAVMPVVDKWQAGSENYAPLSVFFRETKYDSSLWEGNDCVPLEILGQMNGIAELLTFQGAEVYIPSEDIDDSNFDVIIDTASGLIELGESFTNPPVCSTFIPGRPPEEVGIISSDTCPLIGCKNQPALSKWFLGYLKNIEDIQEVESYARKQKEVYEKYDFEKVKSLAKDPARKKSITITSQSTGKTISSIARPMSLLSEGIHPHITAHKKYQRNKPLDKRMEKSNYKLGNHKW